jgi:anti-sigma regulatory factor (Ser/Thr protein kinase)
MQYRPPALISLSGAVDGEAALVGFLGSEPDGENDSDLMIAAGAVDRIDVVSGAAARMRITRHLRRHPAGGVTLALPRDGAVAGRLLELLGKLPDAVTITPDREPPERPRFALIPATQINDPEDAHAAGEFALEACEFARISEERAGIIALTVMELAENSLRHGSEGQDSPVLAASVSGRERGVRVVVLDSGKAISEAPSPTEHLATIPDHANVAGFLPELLRLGKRHDLKVGIEILAGTGRLRWRWDAQRASKGVHVPGTTVIARIDT